MNPINSFRNPAVSFQAKLDYDLGVNEPRWQKIAKEFEQRTASSPDYELILYRTEGDKIILSTLEDDDNQKYHVLSEEGFNKLNKLSDNGIVDKLVKILNVVKKGYKEENTIANMADQVTERAGMPDYSAQAVFNEIMDAADQTIKNQMQEGFDKIPVLKGNIRADVSYYEATKF